MLEMNKLKLLLLCLTLTGCSVSTPASGQKIGRIVKISEEGMFCKTCEGELVRGGFTDGSGSMGGVFKFTITNNTMREIAYQAFEKQQEVILSYHRGCINSLWSSECPSPHFVIAIKIKE